MAKLWDRKYKLIFTGKKDNEKDLIIDFSDLHFSFEINPQTVGSGIYGYGKFRLWNMSDETYKLMRYGGRITLAAGYPDWFGEIFNGIVYFTGRGKEGISTFIDISCVDSANMWLDGFISTNISKGTGDYSRLYTIGQLSTTPPTEMEIKGVNDDKKSFRGSVHFGMLKDEIRLHSRSVGADWGIENGKINIIKQGEYLNDKITIINDKTGLIGLPQATQAGVEVTTLLNPFIKAGFQVEINSKNIQAQQQPEYNAIQNSTYTTLNDDGNYYVQNVKHRGDTRGQDWYTMLICTAQKAGENIEQVQNSQIPKPIKQ